MSGIIGHRGLMFSAGSGPGEYWNPFDKHADVVMSDSNRVAANLAVGDWRSARGVTGHNSGKKYAEAAWVSGLDWAVIFGIASAAFQLDGNVGLGQSVGLQGGGALIGGSGGSGGSAAPGYAAAGRYCRVAVDFDAGRVWLGTQSVWAGGGSPETSTNPTRIISPGGAHFLAGSIYFTAPTGSALRIRTALSDFEGSLPEGFAPWG